MTELALVQSQLEADVEEAPDALAPFREGEPPSARDLGIKAKGLPPQRAMLARLHGWADTKRREIASLAEARDRLSGEIEAATRRATTVATRTAEIARGLIASAIAGKFNIAALDDNEHETIAAAAHQAQARAEIAKTAIAEIDASLQRLHGAVMVIDERIADQAKACLAEHVAPVIAKYRRVADELVDLANELAVADVLIRNGGRMIPKIELPTFHGLGVPDLGTARDDLDFHADARRKRDDDGDRFKGWIRAWRKSATATAPLPPENPEPTEQIDAAPVAPTLIEQLPDELRDFAIDVANATANPLHPAHTWSLRRSRFMLAIERAQESADLQPSDIGAVAAALLEHWADADISNVDHAEIAALSSHPKDQAAVERWRSQPNQEESVV